jgi:NAD(P)-dependent dehydrogenase (short-subunit alcohol dehydrogenase family)
MESKSMTVTLVTGASSGIGMEICRRLAANGHEVVNLSNVEPETKIPARTYLADFTDGKQTAEVLRRLTSDYAIDNLVNNAGITYVTPIEELDLDRMEKVFQVHVRGTVQCVQSVVPAMKARRRGRIVTIGSRVSLGRPERTAYAGAKASLLGISRCLALELAPFGITVNLVSPGPVETSLFRIYHKPDDPKFQQLLNSIPLGRMGKPEDVAAAVQFFLSDGAGFITGQNLFVCGGASVSSAPV